MHQAIRLFIIIILASAIYSCETPKAPKQTAGNSPTPFNYFPETVLPIHIDTIYAKNVANHITRNILEDGKGNIWFATFGGLIQYNGKAFRNWTNETEPARFFSLLEDQNGHIWSGTIGAGIFHYNGIKFQNFTTKDGLIDNRVTNLYEDTNGSIWIGTAGGLSHYDGHHFQNFTTEQGLSNNEINTILRDKTGKLWIGTRGNACTYDGMKFEILKSEQGRTFGNVRQIIKDSQGYIWLGGNDGLWYYDGTSFKSLMMDFTGYIYEDSKGNIWTSAHSSNGQGWILSYYESASLKTNNPVKKIVRTGEGMFFGITEDVRGNIWAGTLDGVCQFDGKTLHYFRR